MARLLPGWSVALAALLPCAAHAGGALYGTVRLGAGPLAGARILLACPSFAARQARAEAISDASGGFALRIGASGRCEMRVERGSQMGPNSEVFVSDNPVRLDFTVDANLARSR